MLTASPKTQTSQPGVRAFTHDDRHFLLDGEPLTIYSGELHYFRIPRPYWEHRLQQAVALGLNTVCTYMPWNLHEPRKGEFDFEGDGGMLDVAAFVKLAASLGLFVILRPSPYICAEWDFGGLPGWLLTKPHCQPRSSETTYLEHVSDYLSRLAVELKSLTIDHGGPIIMVQIENEYGSYSNDTAYLEWLRDELARVGFGKTLLFTSDGPQSDMLNAGTINGTLAVANFGSKAQEGLSTLKRFRPLQPIMCGEFWCGWFDQWGKPRQGSDDPTKAVADLKWMVENDASFSIYMLHGGTNFGFTAGANYYDRYCSTITSYDYRALIDEAGRPTTKYFAFREVLASATAPALTDLPKPPMPIVSIPADRFRFDGATPLFHHLPTPTSDRFPRSMEHYGQYLGGAILYRTSVKGIGGGKLKIVEPRDYAIVFLDGKKIGTIDRRFEEHTLDLPDVEPGARGQLDILVWALGRVNYGPRMLDRKGISDRVELKHLTLSTWQVFSLPMTEADIADLRFSAAQAEGPAFHRANFELSSREVGDTFLDLSHWSIGCVWVNGHNLGRFWNIGPQQTLYCPGCWLKAGTNEIVVFDLEAAGAQRIEGLAEPVLDMVRGDAKPVAATAVS